MDIQEIEAAATRKLEADRNARITAVKDYAESAKLVASLRDDLRDAETQHLAAQRAALRIGWTEADLKGFGIEAPTKSVGGRPRKARPARADGGSAE
jgi:hypothetical protein